MTKHRKVALGPPPHDPDIHAYALAWIDQLMGAEEGSRQAEELKALAVLVETYEAVHFPSENDDGDEES